MNIRGSLKHTCKVISESQTSQSGSGFPRMTETETETCCLFVRQSGSVFDSESGRHIRRNPEVTLPATISVTAENLISTTEPGWAGKYRIRNVDPLEDRYQIRGWVCEIEVIDG